MPSSEGFDPARGTRSESAQLSEMAPSTRRSMQQSQQQEVDRPPIEAHVALQAPTTAPSELAMSTRRSARLPITPIDENGEGSQRVKHRSIKATQRHDLSQGDAIERAHFSAAADQATSDKETPKKRKTASFRCTASEKPLSKVRKSFRYKSVTVTEREAMVRQAAELCVEHYEGDAESFTNDYLELPTAQEIRSLIKREGLMKHSKTASKRGASKD